MYFIEKRVNGYWNGYFIVEEPRVFYFLFYTTKSLIVFILEYSGGTAIVEILWKLLDKEIKMRKSSTSFGIFENLGVFLFIFQFRFGFGFGCWCWFWIEQEKKGNGEKLVKNMFNRPLKTLAKMTEITLSTQLE